MKNEFTTKSNSAGADLTGALQVPEALYASLERHRENLARLVRTLKSVGLSEAQIETSVSVIAASYRDELLLAARSMTR